MSNPTLFLSQSYKDAQADYERMLKNPAFPRWDYVIITASNEGQAVAFRAQLEERRERGWLPVHTHFAVVPDPEGKRVGSGGATLGVIRYIAEHSGSADFSGLRILVIHSGGDSKRVPQYSALGKLFSPVPHRLLGGEASTLFDEFMTGMASVPSRIREGMVLLSGDVLLLFNPLQIDYSGEGAAAITFKEHVETGKNHGVFLRGADGNVARCLQKQSVETLRAYGAVNDRDCVDIDTGAVIFSSAMIRDLYGMISEDGVYSDAKFRHYVNETVRLSLYADFLYPLGSEATLEQFYKEKPEGSFCEELMEARKVVWDILRPYRMKVLRLAPAKFIHFGTTGEILKLMNEEIDGYSYLDWQKTVNCSIAREKVAGYNSVLDHQAVCGQNCYLEVSYVHRNAVIGNNVLLSYIDIHNEVIPDDVVLHGLKQMDGSFVVRIYGIHDNPKGTLAQSASFLGHSLPEFLAHANIMEEELWETEDRSIWTAKLYPKCKTIQEAVQAALNIYEIAQGRGDVRAWKEADRKSLQSGFGEADPYALIAWERRMRELVAMDQIAQLIVDQKPAKAAVGILKNGHLTAIQKKWLEDRFAKADFSEAVRLLYYTGVAIGGLEGEALIQRCFAYIQQSILTGTMEKLEYNSSCKMIGSEYCVRLPLRVNWGGGWSDTPPYCNERGGTVLNQAILLNGTQPVEVTLTRLGDAKIIFESQDMDTYGEFTELAPLQATGDPYDPFALQKAALLACGIIPVQGGNLKEICQRLGGGFHMRTEVRGVPKGSGLGTSSILAAACVQALFGFMGIAHTTDDLYGHVLCMEQIMSTGGGWQDQVGGLTNGLKYITAMPGMKQQIQTSQVVLSPETRQELDERFVLIYTGQRRLARNLLRDVVGRYIGNEPDSLYALNEIQRMAALMRFELERGHVDDFAKLLSEHWKLSQMVDAGSTNTLIDQIFATIDDLIAGKMICGAGGGGFLQVILKKGITKAQVQERLKSVFQDNEIDVWDCTLV